MRPARQLRVPAQAAAPHRGRRPLARRLHRDDEVGAVRHHHVGHLVERLAADLDAVHLQDLVVDGQEAGRLGQAAGHEAGYEYAGEFF